MEAEEAFRAVDFDKGNHNELGGMRRPVSVDVSSLLRTLTATMSLPMSVDVPVTGSPQGPGPCLPPVCIPST